MSTSDEVMIGKGKRKASSGLWEMLWKNIYEEVFLTLNPEYDTNFFYASYTFFKLCSVLPI